MAKRKIGGLFFNAILALSLVSIVPVVLIGWHVLRVDNRILQSEILDKQRSIANRIALQISEQINRQVQFFAVFTELHADFKDHPYINQEDLDYLRSQNTEIIYLSVLNPQGEVVSFSGIHSARSADVKAWQEIESYMQQGRPYIGPIEHHDGRLHLHIALPLYNNHQQKRLAGIFTAKLNLTELENVLLTAYPDNIAVTVLDGHGHAISHVEKEGWIGREITLDNQLQNLPDATGAQLTLTNGTSVLASRVHVPFVEWTIFVQQPADTMSKLVAESLFVSPWDIILIVIILAAFVMAVSYLVLMPIIRPVQRLQEVALEFEKRDDYLPTEKDLIIPSNEIGDLIHVFLHMAEVLFERKAALLVAQKELASMNKNLEQRVEERTAQLNVATDKLVKTEQLAAIGQMASIISHEIRNPLAVISNAARLIRAIQPPTDPKLIKQFSIIDAEIRQANSIIGEVLGYARNRDMILSTIDLNSYLHDMIVSFPVPPTVHIKEDIDPESVQLKVDAEEITQALRNLISNACESMAQGGTVTVGTKVGKQVVCIYVADEGPGISEELKEKIFSPFFTTKARGTGLGLAVVRKAITRHKGKLFVRSEKGKGATFEIYLKIYNKPGDTRYVG